MTRHPALPHHDHGGLADDLARYAALLERRRVVGMMLSGGALAAIGGCGGGADAAGTGSLTSSTTSATTTTTTTTTGSSSCVADAEETAGPYPSDGSNTVNGAASNVLAESGVVRSDIRSSFGSFSGTAPGVPLTLNLSLVNTNNSCAALSGYAVYLWHCTRDGAYSLYSTSIQNQNHLRGVQVSNGSGLLTFQTIFPGCYSGRYPHIHFEVYPSLGMATLYTNKVQTSQMALPRDICSTVYNGATGYAASVTNLAGVTLDTDNVFRDNSTIQLAVMTPTITGNLVDGYTGNIVIGVPA
jgi:protocatechuate 3,4-dioxygenase beta subunit